MNMSLARTDPRSSDGFELALLVAQICCRTGRPAATRKIKKRVLAIRLEIGGALSPKVSLDLRAAEWP